MPIIGSSQPRRPLNAPSNAGTPQSGRAERIIYPENPRYKRIRSLSMLMDQSIVLPNGFRIGLDPILGLVPGLGEVVTSTISCYLVYQSALLGLPKRVLMRMVGNVALESLAGSVPILGDLFDAIWKSNMRNLRLLEEHYHPALAARSPRKIGLWMAAVIGFLVLVMGTAFYIAAQILIAIVSWLTL